MTRIVVPRKTPRLYEATRHVVNGVQPSHVVAGAASYLSNFATVRCRKTYFQRGGPGFAAGSNIDIWHFSFHSGDAESGSLKMRVVASGYAGCKFTLSLTPDGGSTATETYQVRASGVSGAIGRMTGELAITGDTLYTGFISVLSGFNSPSSLTLYGVHSESLSASHASTVDSRTMHNKAAIYDTQHQRLVEQTHSLYQKQGKSLISLAVDDPANAWTRTSATAVNMIDGTTTTVTSSTPGCNLALSNLAPRHGTTVGAVLKVFGSRAGGGSSHVQLHDSSGQIAAVSLGVSEGWATNSSVALTPGEKVDVYIRGDGSSATTVKSVMLYLWET